MKPTLTAIDVPACSALSPEARVSYFHDSLRLDLDPGERPAIEVCLQTLFKTPRWVDAAMALRNRVGGWVGLKDLGRMSAIDPARPGCSYRVGERLGIFTLLAISDHEVVLGDCDKHLDVKVSVCKLDEPGRRAVAVSTVVHVHNALGRLYMLFVGPAHKVIAPAVLARARLTG
jgi:hypothetical protein